MRSLAVFLCLIALAAAGVNVAPAPGGPAAAAPAAAPAAGPPQKGDAQALKLPKVAQTAAKALATEVLNALKALKFEGKDAVKQIYVNAVPLSKKSDEYGVEVVLPAHLFTPKFVDDNKQNGDAFGSSEMKQINAAKDSVWYKKSKNDKSKKEPALSKEAQAKNFELVAEAASKLVFGKAQLSYSVESKVYLDMDRASLLHQMRTRLREQLHGFAAGKPIGGGFFDTDPGNDLANAAANCHANGAGCGTIGGILCDTRTNWPYAVSNSHVWPATVTVKHSAAAKIYGKVAATNKNAVNQVDVAALKLEDYIWARNAFRNANYGWTAVTGIHAAGAARPNAGQHVGLAVDKSGGRLHFVSGIIRLSGPPAAATHGDNPDYVIRANNWASFNDGLGRVDYNTIGANWGGNPRWVPNNEHGVFNRVAGEVIAHRPAWMSQPAAVNAIRQLHVNGLFTAFSMGGDSGSWVYHAGTGNVVCLNFGGIFAWRFTQRRAPGALGAVGAFLGHHAPAPVPGAVDMDLYWVWGAHRDGVCYSFQSQIDEINRILNVGSVPPQVEICNTEFPMPVKYTFKPFGKPVVTNLYAKGEGQRDVDWLKQTIVTAHGVPAAGAGAYKIRKIVAGAPPTELAQGNQLLTAAFPQPPYEVEVYQPDPKKLHGEDMVKRI